jgi:hypothetical protein
MNPWPRSPIAAAKTIILNPEKGISSTVIGFIDRLPGRCEIMNNVMIVIC